jgi:hypothetical protein
VGFEVGEDNVKIDLRGKGYVGVLQNGGHLVNMVMNLRVL